MTETNTDLCSMSLHRISQLPFDASAEIFRHYPAFKLGVTYAVRHYAQLLLPMVQSLIASDSEHSGWILTSPAIAGHAPAGANLLCRELFDLYLRERNSEEVSLIDIRYENERMASIDYAKMEYADRVTERERLGRQLVPDANFRGRPVLFVNDICITGAQEQTMQRYFKSVEAACVRFLYLVFVEPEIGKSKPDIEWQINFAPFADLLRLVSSEDIRFTGKCVLMLMHLSVAELEQVVRAFDRDRRARLLELAELNGFQDLDGFKEKMKLLRSYTTVKTAPGTT